MSIYEAIVDIIGVPPVGYEPLLYVAVVLFVLFIISNAFMLIGGIIKKLGGL